jgi:hypothetical protein
MPEDPDITRLKATITDLIAVGSSMYDPTAGSMTSDALSRNNELTAKKESLDAEIKEQESIVNRVNRDFTDVRDQLPETIPDKKLHFIEDYTLVILGISYLFMILIALHTYVLKSEEAWTMSLLRGLMYSIPISLIVGMIIYYIC